MKGGGLSSGPPGKGANQAPRAGVRAPSPKAVSSTAPKINSTAAGPKQLQKKAPTQPKPEALAKPIRTPGKATHKVRVTKPNYTSQVYKQQLGKRGEDAARRALKKQKGVNSVRSMKHNRIQGIDLAALQLARNGKIKKASVVESKAGRNRHPGPSSFRDQTTHSYVQKNLRKAKIKNVKHAAKLYEMAKNRKLGIIGSTYNKETGRVRLYKVFEPNTPKDQGSKRKR